MPVEQNKQPAATRQDFPIIGIGASAGGLHAFRKLLAEIPINSGMAYVIVQHLDPTHNSILAEILSEHTKIPVREITNDIHLIPDTIYVIPENSVLTSVDGMLKLNPRDKKKNGQIINTFFMSLAEVYLNLAVGVVLSGNGSDGTLGLKAIQLHGGTTFAQHPDATNPEMPQSAILAGVVDFILSAAEIPAKLMEIRDRLKDVVSDNYLKEEERNVGEIIHLLHQRNGVDFTFYKQTTVRRRIARRMSISKSPDLAHYLHLLQQDVTATEDLFNDLLIPVTEFFRDPKIFQSLRETVLPELMKGVPKSGAVRMWIAGCSTGEEAYSLAISLHEHLENNPTGNKIQIFASDLSEPAIAKARIGRYPKSQLKNVSEQRLARYFTLQDDLYQINSEIRDLCIFAIHNFLKDPPFAKMDLISCRNVLIYMDPVLQKKSLTTFHYALKAKGVLLLGKSETTAPGENLFLKFGKGLKIYSRRQVSDQFLRTAIINTEPARQKQLQKATPEIMKTDFKKSADSILLANHIPASVVVNEQMDIVQIYGEIHHFLEFSSGKPTLNLLKIAHDGLSSELRSAWRKVQETGCSVLKEGVQSKNKGAIRNISFEFIPLTATSSPHFLVVFRPQAFPEAVAYADGLSAEEVYNDRNVMRIRQLEDELSKIHEDINAISEDHKSFTDELQTTNEELLSGSEELQTLNEELETSKEELQSSNEELIIINQELMDKQQQITISQNYTKAVVDTLREPIVVLNQYLQIKNVNRAFIDKFRITGQESEGKSIFEIQNHLFDSDRLRNKLKQVIPQQLQLDDYQISMNLLPYGKRIFLLNARLVTNETSNEALILLAIEDITERRKTENSLKVLSDGFELKVEERTADLVTSNSALEGIISELNVANIQLQQFAYVASHDLQEPLRKILVFISRLLVMDKDLPDEIVAVLHKIHSSSDRMKNLINDLLSYSYLSNHDDQFESTDLNGILKNVLMDFELLIEEQKTQLTIGVLPTINAIPLHMNQLFYNLISNALKFRKSDDSLQHIEVKSKKMTPLQVQTHSSLDPALSYCKITFRDNGIGFDKQYKNRIFNLFQRLHNKDVYTGTGIGLAIGKKIVDDHKGIIFSESQKNKGAAFHIILPVA